MLGSRNAKRARLAGPGLHMPADPFARAILSKSKIGKTWNSEIESVVNISFLKSRQEASHQSLNFETIGQPARQSTSKSVSQPLSQLVSLVSQLFTFQALASLSLDFCYHEDP